MFDFLHECDIYPKCKKFHGISDCLLKRCENLIENLGRIEEGKIEEWLEEEDRNSNVPNMPNQFPYI